MEDLLPTELTIDILSRLTVKTIIHCKCVCKKWRNLVIDSSFVHLHLSRSPTTLIIHHKPTMDPEISLKWYERREPGTLGWVEIEDKDDYHRLHLDPLMSLDLNLAPVLQKYPIDLKGSVNGLICLWQHHPNLEIDHTCICNPVTREYMILPRQNYFRKLTVRVTYGFGVSSITGEYKVLRTLRSYKNHSIAEVYTLGTAQWRSIGHVPCQPSQPYYTDGSFLNNHFHWISYDDDNADAPGNIFTFDLDKETFQLFPSSPPPPYVEEEAIRHSLEECLAILKGCLCKMDSIESQFTIWVMKEYGIKESWHKEVVINQSMSPDLDWPMLDPYLYVGLKDGSILTVCEGSLWAFYPKDKTIEDTRLFNFSYSMNGVAYRPSFLKLQSFESERVHMF